jgi:hypothetical protein
MALERIDQHNPTKEIQRNYDDFDFVRCCGDGLPLSGPSPYGTFAGFAGPGSIYVDKNTGTKYFNEGTLANPYWTPVSYDQPTLFGAHSDWRDGVGEPLADTDAALTIPGSGVRVHGQGIAEIDSGAVVTHGEGGPVMRLTTTDEDEHLVALGYGGTTVPFQPDTHGPLVVDAEVSMVSAITLRSLFLGFLGTAADALDPAVTASGVTATLVQDDLAGVVFDAEFTDADRLYAVHNKSDEAASQDVSASGRDTSVDFPAAGTYARLRVEISAAGVMAVFKDKVQVARIAAALDVDEEVAPALYIRSTSAAVKSMDVKRFATWGKRA